MEDNSRNVTVLLDLRGLCCGGLIRKLTSEIGAAKVGESFLAQGDNESPRKDTPAYCRQMHHELLQHEEQRGCCASGSARAADEGATVIGNRLSFS